MNSGESTVWSGSFQLQHGLFNDEMTTEILYKNENSSSIGGIGVYGHKHE